MPLLTHTQDRPPVMRLSDEQIEQVVGNLLRVGVLLAAVVVLVGGFIYISHHGSATPHYRVFHRMDASLRSVSGILRSSVTFEGRAIIQLGLLLLIATPVSRVALSLVAFMIQRDRMYVVITFIVLAVLLYSLFGGAHV